MQLGLRPRLKARPSLLDLITRKDIARLSTQQIAAEQDAIDFDPLPTRVPLPGSPTKETSFTPVSEEIPSVVVNHFDEQEDSESEEEATMPKVGQGW